MAKADQERPFRFIKYKRFHLLFSIISRALGSGPLTIMKYIKYLLIMLIIDGLVFLVLAIFSSVGYAIQIAIIVLPLSLWTARLIVAHRSGEVTRRMRFLDGGPVFAGNFWCFRPEVYKRRPGFDNFKGYFIKETLACFLGWVMFLSIPVVKVLHDFGFDVR